MTFLRDNLYPEEWQQRVDLGGDDGEFGYIGLSETGLYKLIFKSTKGAARHTQDRIARALPSILEHADVYPASAAWPFAPTKQ